ncbi:MAG: Coenzyme F420 hydrogenase/dehydrogenase, beta subunit C-terminal domain [Collinsella sp.]
MDTVSHRACFGCGACAAKCPFSAITMRTSPDGFEYPVVDAARCTSCGLCLRTCPAETKSTRTRRPFAPPVLQSDDLTSSRKVRPAASSFSAKRILSDGGRISRRCWDGVDHVRHIGISELAEIALLQKSKYVQSDASESYPEVLSDLKLASEVLFSGTPCQASALRLYLGKPMDGLTTVSVVCHGVPSSSMFRSYVGWLELREKSDVTALTFRDKSKFGWGHNIKIELSDGRIIKRPAAFDPFYGSYIKGLISRSSCYGCPFRGCDSPADIILGDSWRSESVQDCGHPEKGVSAVIVKTERGAKLIDEIGDYVAYSNNGLAPDDVLLHEDPNKRSDLEEARCRYRAVRGYRITSL